MNTFDPNTIRGAVGTVINAITAEGAAQAIGKSTALVYKFTKTQATPSIYQCIALDIAYEAKTGLPGPILRAARGKVEAAQTEQAEAHCLNDDIVSLTEELGAFACTTRKAWDDRRISPLEQAELKSALFRLEMVAHATRENIDAHCDGDRPVQPETARQIELAYH